MNPKSLYSLAVIKASTARFFSTGTRNFKAHQNYYEVLGVNRNCTPKELKTAYVKLCKEHHPDRKPDDPDQHKKFLSLREAYDVLSQPDSRSRYDSTINVSRRTVPYANSEQIIRQRPWRDETLWSMRDKSRDRFYDGRNYYGPFYKDGGRLPHMNIVYACVFLISTGALLHIMFYNLMAGISERRLREKDSVNFEIYAEVRNRAMENTNAKQLELLFQDVNKPKSES